MPFKCFKASILHVFQWNDQLIQEFTLYSHSSAIWPLEDPVWASFRSFPLFSGDAKVAKIEKLLKFELIKNKTFNLFMKTE